MKLNVRTRLRLLTFLLESFAVTGPTVYWSKFLYLSSRDRCVLIRLLMRKRSVNHQGCTFELTDRQYEAFRKMDDTAYREELFKCMLETRRLKLEALLKRKIQSLYELSDAMR